MPASLPPSGLRSRLLHCTVWPLAGEGLLLFLSCVCVKGGPRDTQPAVTIASQLSIKHIISHPEPPDADAATSPSNSAQIPTPKRKFHDAFAPPAPDAPIESARPPAPPPPPPDRLPNIRQPLPHSSPRPNAVGAVRTQGLTAAGPAAGDDDSRSPGAATMMAVSPGSPGIAADFKKGIKRAPLRSSIACHRCRKSKIKCNNTGGDAPCETCIRNGKECTYPEVAPAPPKRSEPSGGPKVDQGSERKRPRRVEDVVRLTDGVPGSVIAEDVLSAKYLTETV